MSRRSNRGEYRGIHRVLLDEPDYQLLTPDARLVLLTLKITLGPCQIDVVPGLVVSLTERTGLSTERAQIGVQGLVSSGWLEIERNVVWVARGLECEPSLTVSNGKHRQGVQAHIYGLPNFAILSRFRERYATWFDFGLTASDTQAIAIPDPCHSHGEAIPDPSEAPRPKTETDNRDRKLKAETEAFAPSASAVEVLPAEYQDDLQGFLLTSHRRMRCSAKFGNLPLEVTRPRLGRILTM